MARNLSLGTKQQITYTLLPGNFGETPEQSQACIAGLNALGIQTRNDLEDHLVKAAVDLLKSSRDAGLSDLQRRENETKRLEALEHLEQLQEIIGIGTHHLRDEIEAKFAPPKPDAEVEPYVLDPDSPYSAAIQEAHEAGAGGRPLKLIEKPNSI